MQPLHILCMRRSMAGKSVCSCPKRILVDAFLWWLLCWPGRARLVHR